MRQVIDKEGGPNPAGRGMTLGALGVALLAWVAALHGLSPHFVYGSDMTVRPIMLLTAVLCGGAFIYLGAAWVACRTAISKKLLALIFGVGLAARVLLMPAPPMLEDDFYRYLWDGGVVASGHNPYAYAPEAVAAGGAGVPPALTALAEDAGIVFERVNHPPLKTLYPPVAQAVFCAAHWLGPWRLGALKAVYLLLDLAALALLGLLLRQYGRPMAWILLYWWNPLLLKECYNSGHMDLILVPLLLAALLFAARARPVSAMTFLALAAGVKIWPVLLAPFLLWPARDRPARMCAAALVFAVICVALAAPVLMAATEGADDSGLVAYSERWEMNDALYMAFPWAAKHIASWTGEPLVKAVAQRIARYIVAALLALLVAALAWRLGKGDTGSRLCAAALYAVTAMFMLSPVQFPWYFLWLLPLLALRPSPGLLLLTATLPLYYLKFHYAARGDAAFFHYRIVWVEFAPVWVLLAWEAVTRRGLFARAYPQAGRVPSDRRFSA